MDEAEKVALIIALTAEEAVGCAAHHRLGDAWRFVVEPNDLRGKTRTASCSCR
jgi:hypothetical protein